MNISVSRYCGAWVFIYLYACLPFSNGNPVISCKSPSFDFGVIMPTNEVKHTFVLENSGEQTLRIEKIRACCGGKAVAKGNKRELPPGSSLEIDTHLFIGKRRGRIRKSFYVKTNDPKQPYFQLRYLGEVQSQRGNTPVNLAPSELDFGRVRVDTEAVQEVTLSFETNAAFSVTAVSCTSKYFTVSCRSGTSPNVFSIQVKTKPPILDGRVVDTLSITTDHPQYLRLEVPLSLYVFKDIIVAPSEVVFLAQDEQLTRYLAVRSRSKTPFTILETTLPDPDINVEIAPLGDYGYRIMMRNILPDEDIDGQYIVIRTDSEENKEITVPFRLVTKK